MTIAQKIPMACDCASFVIWNLKPRKALFILLPQEPQTSDVPLSATVWQLTTD